MSRNPVLASILSVLVPGLGQMYSGKGARGAAILVAVIVGGNLNAIWLSLHAAVSDKPKMFWSHTLPRILHDWFAAYGIVFWIWQVIDAHRQAQKGSGHIADCACCAPDDPSAGAG
jgi:TM2 domain-containing membrane protein YozV